MGIAAGGTALFAAVAFACTNLATLNLSSATGKVGDSIVLTGSSFSVNSSNVANSTPVVVSWNGANGPVLATVTPDKGGNISAPFSIPEGAPGYYVIVATQKNASGVDAYGTPARASFQILGPNGALAAPGAAATPAALASEGSGSGIIALTVGLGALGMALFGAGFVAFVRQVRRRDVPAAAAVRRD
ncbi:MAG: hypothetical protein ACRD0D_00660 [Acidimicrobiales bacterium]